MSTTHYDALVIGAGIGGLCAAARLVDAGHRTLLVERLDLTGLDRALPFANG
jgi:phytoene dehydrogenase-like protein